MNAIEIKNLTKTYMLYERNVFDRFADTFLLGKKKRHKEFHALADINLTVKKGEIIGILGRNGAGKSTLLKLISGITQPTFGNVKVNGRVVALLELGVGFNPEYTGKDNIYFTCALQGMSKEEIDSVYDEIMAFAELGEFINVPVKKYSSGMRARLGFATSINIDPDILILDEVLSVGDELFKRKCFVKMESFFKSGKTILFVSHNINSIREICTKSIILHNGSILLQGTTDLVTQKYREYLKKFNDKIKFDNYVRNIVNNRNENYEIINNETTYYFKKNINNKIIKHSKRNIENTKAYLLDGFTANSTQIIKNKDVELNNISLRTEENVEVNHLVYNDKYKISFEAKINVEVTDLSLGVIILDDKSNVISSYFLTGNEIERKKMEDNKYIFNSNFNCLLKEGLYGIRIEAREIINGQRTLLSTVIDAKIFSVYIGPEKSHENKVCLFF
jgi:lipopolysaccharide transport system ATP-binding protein